MKNTRWPSMMPLDLHRSVEGVLSMRSPCAADVWTEVRDWLVRHGAEAPAELPTDRPGDGWRGSA